MSKFFEVTQPSQKNDDKVDVLFPAIPQSFALQKEEASRW
jgi:hypothetical protein